MPTFRLSLLKVFDEAILPAFLVIGTKLISFLLLAIFTGLVVKFPGDLTSMFFITPALVANAEKIVFVNSVSSLFTLLTILVVFGWVIIKAHHFHETHLPPRFHQKLIKSNLEHLITTSHEIYHQGLVWTALSWAFFFHLLAETGAGLVAWWVPLVATAVVFALTMMLIEDVINELKIQKNTV